MEYRREGLRLSQRCNFRQRLRHHLLGRIRDRGLLPGELPSLWQSSQRHGQLSEQHCRVTELGRVYGWHQQHGYFRRGSGSTANKLYCLGLLLGRLSAHVLLWQRSRDKGLHFGARSRHDRLRRLSGNSRRQRQAELHVRCYAEPIPDEREPPAAGKRSCRWHERLFADGHVSLLPGTMDPAVWWAIQTPAGGETNSNW